MLKRQPKKQEESIVDTLLEAVRTKVESGEISMSELARRAGVGRPYLYRILSREQTPSLPIAEKIARALGMSFDLKADNLVA